MLLMPLMLFVVVVVVAVLTGRWRRHIVLVSVLAVLLGWHYCHRRRHSHSLRRGGRRQLLKEGQVCLSAHGLWGWGWVRLRFRHTHICNRQVDDFRKRERDQFATAVLRC
jgi:hypothetical protein